MNDEEPQAEIVIHQPTSKDGKTGWTVRLVRQETTDVIGTKWAEDDDAYTARVLAKHRELEEKLLDVHANCHPAGDLDACQQAVKEGSRE